jgi:hypothetical protein
MTLNQLCSFESYRAYQAPSEVMRALPSLKSPVELNTFGECYYRSLPKAKGAKTQAAEPPKLNNPSTVNHEANDGQPAPPPGPLVGRLVISMPVRSLN